MNIESIKAKLKNYSRKNNKVHQNTLTKFFQERSLYRLSISNYKHNFLLKGGALAYTIGGDDSRHTKDIDFLISKLQAEQENLRTVFEDICETTSNDGVLFKSKNIKVETIQKEGNYSGTRIKVEAKLGKISQQVQVDIGVGDYVTPGPQEIEFPTILKELPSPMMLAYSIETLISEKFHAMIDLGEFNSRMKDFYDVYTLIEKCDKKILGTAIKNTFKRRKATIIPNHPVFQAEFFTDERRAKQWFNFLQRNGLQKIPFTDVREKLMDYLYPIYSDLG
ncbi:MAG: nucleotidyl transferase AbiEii/AbiGii toxin family protein [Bacteroidota bacterium]